MVVNYRQWDATARLVRQLWGSWAIRRDEAEVVIVDNHSPPHRLVGMLRRQPGVSLRRWGRNHGFARAVNEGCRLSRGTWVLLMNPDVTVPPDFLDGVLSRLEELTRAEPRAGIVGFGLRNGDGSRQLSSGPFPTLASTLLGLVLPRSLRKYRSEAGTRRRQVPWVTGCGLLIRRDLLRRLGGLDDGFFLYYEDVDLCKRARALGWSVWLEPAPYLIHHAPLHRRRVPPLTRLFTRHSLLTYAARHWPAGQARLLARLVRAEALGRSLWARLRGDRRAADLFGELHTLAGDLAAGREDRARRRLLRVVRREEESSGG